MVGSNGCSVLRKTSLMNFPLCVQGGDNYYTGHVAIVKPPIKDTQNEGMGAITSRISDRHSE